jgi:DNA-binding GntR family transcriptional regulator
VSEELSFPRLQRTSTTDRVVQLLRDKILAGELPPGTALPEVALAESLGISRNTLREAVRTLAAEGLLRRSAHRGATVPELTEQDAEEIYRVRKMLELAAIDAAGRKKRPDVGPLRAQVRELAGAIEVRNWRGIVEHDLGFHRALVSFLGSSRLEHFYWMLLSELLVEFVSLDRSQDKPIQFIPRQHAKLVGYLSSGQTEKARKVLSEHLDDSEQRLRSLLRNRSKSEA